MFFFDIMRVPCLLTQGDTESVCTYTLKVLNTSTSFESYYQLENGTVIFKIPVDKVEPNREYEVYIEISNAAGSSITHTATFSNNIILLLIEC